MPRGVSPKRSLGKATGSPEAKRRVFLDAGGTPLNTDPTPPLKGRGQILLKLERVLKFRSAVAEDKATQPPTQRVQGSAEKPKGPRLPQLPPPHEDDEEEPEHVRTVTVGEDDQARPSTSKLVGVPVEVVMSEGDTEDDEEEYSGDDEDYIDEDDYTVVNEEGYFNKQKNNCY